MEQSEAKPEPAGQRTDAPIVIISRCFSEDLKAIYGKLYIDGFYFCDTGEPIYYESKNISPKIPKGRYLCELGMHIGSHGKYYTYEVKNVPGHSGLLFHPGNDPSVDSKGCILLGDKSFLPVGPERLPRLIGSREAFNRFILRFKDYPEFILVVI